MKSFLVYKFTCTSCSSNYIGETCRHFKTRIEEHIIKDNNSYVFKHLHSIATCFDSYNYLYFKITNKANSKFDLKLKKLYILIGENVNAQQNHLTLTLSLWLLSLLVLFSPCLFIFLLSFLLLLFFLLHFSSVLLVLFCLCLFIYLFIYLFIFCVSLSSFISLSLTLIIGIFYCPNYTSLLLHLFIILLEIDFIIAM